MALQIRRGTDAERLALSGVNAPAPGELIYTLDTKKLYVGDGTTAGGNQVDTTLSAQYLSVPSNITPDASNTRDIGSSSASWRTGYFQGLQVSEEITAVSFNGNVVDNGSTVMVDVNTGTVNAVLNGNVIASDTSTIIDSTAKTVTATTIGTHKGTVNADDNSLRIDGASDRITNSVLDFDGNVITLQSGNGIQIGTNTSLDGVGIEILNTNVPARNAIRTYSSYVDANTFNSIEAYASGGTIATPLQSNLDDSLFGYVHYGHDGSNYVQSSFIVAGVDSAPATIGPNAVPGYLLLGTTPDNGVTLNSAVLNSEGNFGIGILNPTTKLDVDGGIAATGPISTGAYTDASARDTALPTPQRGSIIFLTGTGKFQGNTDGTITGWVDLN